VIVKKIHILQDILINFQKKFIVRVIIIGNIMMDENHP
jgi:hypothetical protein